MSDELLRQLERAAASGDPEAKAKFIICRRRHGRDPIILVLHSLSQLEIRMAEIIKDMVWSEPALPDLSEVIKDLTKSMSIASESFKLLGECIPKNAKGGTVTFKSGVSVTHDEYREQCTRSQAPFRRPKKRQGRGPQVRRR